MTAKQGELQRLREMLSIIRHSGILKQPTPEKLRLTVEALGPTYVKFGQILSMRNDLLPEAYCEELTKLRSEMTELPFAEIRRIIESEWGVAVEQRLASIDPQAAGTASIAQVHRATLPDGTKVVLKVQRQGIYETMDRDIRLLHTLVRRIRLFVPRLRREVADTIDPDVIIDEIWRTAQEELDFTVEARNFATFKQNNEAVNYVCCPEVYTDLSTSRVLVMEDIQGIRIDDLDSLRELEYEPREIAEKLVENYIKQIIDDGFFQADPHPGNLLIRGGKICWIDLGMMGQLEYYQRELLNRAILGVVSNDSNEVTDVLLILAEETRPVSRTALRTDVERLLGRYVNMPMREMNLGIMFSEMIRLARQHGLRLPGSITMLGRGIMTMQGTLVLIDPEINFIAMLRGHIKSLEFISAELRKQLSESVDYLLSSGHKALKIPGELSNVLHRANTGDLELTVTNSGQREEQAEKRLYHRQLVLVLLIGLFSLSAAVFALSPVGHLLLGLAWPSWLFLGLALAALIRLIYISTKSG